MSVSKIIFQNFFHHSHSLCFKQEYIHSNIINRLPFEKSLKSYCSYTLRKFNVVRHVRQLGYPFEVHSDLETSDGYLLDLHRVPHGKDNKSKDKIPILLMHGLGQSGDSWIIPGPQHSLAFLLADTGYDVWIGNARGTTSSKKHRLIDPKHNPGRFWDFSWHEIGYYDLYTKIVHIMRITKQSKLFYIGHCQGCTSFFVLMSKRPEMNQNIKLMVALAPTVFLNPSHILERQGYAYSLFRRMDITRTLLELFTQIMDPEMKRLVCASKLATSATCEILFKSIENSMRFDPSKTRPEHWALMRLIMPDSSSTKQYFHYIQNGLLGEFRQYHYGKIKNFIKYGRKYPSSYKLNKVTCPVALFSGDEDTFATPECVKKLGTNLSKVVEQKVLSGFGHLDFISSDTASELLYKNMFDLMSKFSN